MTQHRAFLPYLILLAGVLVASTAAIMIRHAQQLGVDSLSIAAGRLTFAALLLTPIAWSRAGDELRAMARRDWLWALAAGGFLAIHFATWISSLAFTSVASSTALVATNPIFVALGSWLIFRERQPVGVWLGVALTVSGSILIGFSDSGGGSGANPLLGDLLALLGAMGGSAYFLVGRSLRRHLTTLPYIWTVYSTAAVVLLVWMALAGGSLWGLPPLAYLLLLGLALGPQLLGHTAFNWSIRYVSATVVTVAILGEPIGSTILAFWLLDQRVQPLQVIGGLILLVGIAAATLAEHRAHRAARQAIEVEGALAQ